MATRPGTAVNALEVFPLEPAVGEAEARDYVKNLKTNVAAVKAQYEKMMRDIRYDPVLVQTLVNVLGRFPPGTLLELNGAGAANVRASAEGVSVGLGWWL